MPMPRNTVEDFWAQVDRSVDCWLWTGRKDANGYGRFSYQAPAGRIQVASHMAWYVSHGELPTSPLVCHHCDNPPCVRPDHLFQGTTVDNNRDRDAKGRQPSKLTRDQVCEARALRAGGWRYRELGQRYGVDFSTVWKALNGSTWRHVT